jgi:hypothetical protein
MCYIGLDLHKRKISTSCEELHTKRFSLDLYIQTSQASRKLDHPLEQFVGTFLRAGPSRVLRVERRFRMKSSGKKA